MANKLQLSTAGVSYVQTGTFMDIMTPMAKRKVTIEEAEPETEIQETAPGLDEPEVTTQPAEELQSAPDEPLAEIPQIAEEPQPEPTPEHTESPEMPLPESSKGPKLFKQRGPTLPAHWQWYASGVAGALVLVGGLTAAAYLGNFTLGKVRAGSVAIQPKNIVVSKKAIDTAAAHYTFTLAYPDKTAKTYQLKDAGITVDSNKTAAVANKAVKDLGWKRFAWWHTTTVPLTIAKNDADFKAFVDKNVAIANQVATDATISADDGEAVITPDKAGWTYSVPGGNQKIAAAAQALSPLSVSLIKTTVTPALTANDLTSAKNKITDYLNHTVTFTIGDRAIKASKAAMADWLDIQAQPDHKTADVSVNSGKIQVYLDSITRNDVYPARPQITMAAADGSISVLSQGLNGQSITNLAEVVKAVASGLGQSPTAINQTLTIDTQNFTTVNAADYDKWILADLTNKRMYAYEHGNVVNTVLISAGAPATPTPVGTYKIYTKFASQNMTGANADGSRYYQPNVQWVSYFYKDIAIHGNYWRPTSYFGNINASHGCIGTVNSDAKWFYDWAPVGTTVITIR